MKVALISPPRLKVLAVGFLAFLLSSSFEVRGEEGGGFPLWFGTFSFGFGKHFYNRAEYVGPGSVDEFGLEGFGGFSGAISVGKGHFVGLVANVDFDLTLSVFNSTEYARGFWGLGHWWFIEGDATEGGPFVRWALARVKNEMKDDDDTILMKYWTYGVELGGGYKLGSAGWPRLYLELRYAYAPQPGGASHFLGTGAGLMF